MSEIFKISPSLRLFKSQPSFIEGLARILDIGATFQESSKQYYISKNEVEADTKAVKNDWEAVGSDIKTALNKYEQSTKK